MENINGDDYRLKELTPQVREKALALASGYKNNGMDSNEALQKGIAEAEEWFTELEG
ncbi:MULTISPECIES: hypothetical protein [Pedobacter]|uniref:hypothetical protein n=1 Tax=Pedobacter TaxID=84567 RepID=UPI0012FAA3E7|nr:MULTISPECIES: hypothetical protein [Pedobacter]